MDDTDHKDRPSEEHVETAKHVAVDAGIKQANPEIYLEALQRYPNDESIDRAEERKLIKKLDRRILPLLGVCYFFYYVDKTTL